MENGFPERPAGSAVAGDLPPDRMLRVNLQRLPGEFGEDRFGSLPPRREPQGGGIDGASRYQLGRKPEDLRPIQAIRLTESHDEFFVRQDARIGRPEPRGGSARPDNDPRAARVRNLDEPVLDASGIRDGLLEDEAFHPAPQGRNVPCHAEPFRERSFSRGHAGQSDYTRSPRRACVL